MKSGSSILVGLSGGGDSVALTSALLELRERLGVRVVAAHLNHRIRGAESDRDEEFVRAMCSRLGVELIVERADVLGAISGYVANLEEQAREVRHDFLSRAADRAAADFVALGHHRDDQAETVLMRLMRGAGATGMAAMAERGPGRLIRPMLSISREEIRDYLDARGIPFLEDSSNSSRDILRNRIRVELLPMIEREYALGLARRLVELAGEMRSLDELVVSIASRELAAMRTGGGALDVAGFGALNRAVQAAAIRLYVAERIGSLRKFSRAHIEAIRELILDGGPSASIDLPGGWRAERQYNFLQLVNDQRRIAASGAGVPARHVTERRAGTPAPLSSVSDRFSVAIAADGVTIVEAAGFKFEASTMAASAASMPDSLSVAMFDAAKIADGGMIARNFIEGDRLHPVGMRGTRKVHDVFVDRKLPRARRGSFPVVMVGDSIAWLPGLARADCALVTKATETVVRVEASEIAA
ncbi:MAG TPA: tRNA lysidine(34) synthetase TilS [Candidatus Acidoferrum sp.]|nr:tRNA lysidine(34) synthetase TilS [Candidatus Acidoferrum sp.]